MTAPTVTELPELPTFPPGPGLPDQPGVFIPQFLAFLEALRNWPGELNALVAYLEGLGGGGGGSSGSLRWNVLTSAADAYTVGSGDVGAHVRFSNDSGVLVIVPTDGSHGFAAGDRLRITQDGEGEVAIVPATGVTINAIHGLVSLGRGAVFEIEFVGDGEWDALGDLTSYLIALSGDETDGDDLILLSGDMSDGEDFELTSGV